MSIDKFQNKYRIASARASWWNYGWNGPILLQSVRQIEIIFSVKLKMAKCNYHLSVYWQMYFGMK